MVSMSSCPGLMIPAMERTVSTCALKGTAITTVVAPSITAVFSPPIAPGSSLAVACAASARRDPIRTVTPAWAHRVASPCPRAPVPPTMVTMSPS